MTTANVEYVLGFIKSTAHSQQQEQVQLVVMNNHKIYEWHLLCALSLTRDELLKLSTAERLATDRSFLLQNAFVLVEPNHRPCSVHQVFSYSFQGWSLRPLSRVCKNPMQVH